MLALGSAISGGRCRDQGDRVGIALPNGLPMIVSFLAASIAGTAAPLNPAYKEDEFRFYLEDTSAKVLILPPEGIDEARKAAADSVPYFRSTWTHPVRSRERRVHVDRKEDSAPESAAALRASSMPSGERVQEPSPRYLRDATRTCNLCL